MNRILMGDVGSGKTVVAFAAVYFAIKCGYQAALMAPTEILASQHFGTAKNFLSRLESKLLICPEALLPPRKKPS